MSDNKYQLPADAPARRTALDTSRSFSVQAPAGSGKTELLTQRMLCLLARVATPEEVLAFTFTRKAAGEMRQRLIRSLREAATTPANALEGLSPHKAATIKMAHAVLARDQEQQWQLLQNTHRLQVMTIDSFNHGLTAQLPLSASMGGAARITEDINPIFARAVQRLLEKLEARSETARLLGILLGHLHNNLREAEQLLIALLEKREQWLPLIYEMKRRAAEPHALLGESLQIIITEQLTQLQNSLQPWSRELLTLIRWCAGNLADKPEHTLHLLADQMTLPENEASALPLWKAIAGFLLTKNPVNFRKTSGLNIKLGFPAPSSTKNSELKSRYDQAKADFGAMACAMSDAGLLPLLHQATLLPDPLVSDAHGAVLNALVDLLPQLTTELIVAMQEASEVDFTQTTLAALQALGSLDEPTDLALKLDYRISHILVDEFQDTSTIQYKLLELLTRGWQPDDGRTLFVVGDGMQSCYGFRNARVELFMQMRERGLDTVPMEALDLSVNFRSDQSVVDAVNAVFSRVFPAIMDPAHGGVPYSASETRPDVPAGLGVHLDLWVRDDSAEIDNNTHHTIEAEAVAERIISLQQEDAGQSIAILVRNRRHISAIVPALRHRGILFNATEIDPLLSYPVISDLFVLLKAMLNLADDVSWFALLRSPLVGLALEDFTVLAMQKHAQACSVWSAWQQSGAYPDMSEDARQRLQRTATAIAHALLSRQQRDTRTLLEDLWEQLGGPHCVSDDWMLPNIESFLTLVEQYDDPGQFNLGGFTERLQSTWGNVAAPDVNLTIQTIHKSKGLEFDAVLIPGLQRGGGRRDSPLMQWHEYIDACNNSHPILALLPAKGEDPDPLYAYLKHEAGLRENNEATRLLYIAVTRAARSAWLFGRANQDKDTLAAPAGSLLQTIEAVLNNPPPQLQVTVREYPETAGTHVAPVDGPVTSQPLRRLPLSLRLPLPESHTTEVGELQEAEPQHLQLLARQMGELVHLGLQMVVEQGTTWLENGFPPVFRARLSPLCTSQAALQAAVETVMNQINTCLAAPEADWLFDNTHRESACELAMVDYRQPYRRDHVIDRTFIDAAGTRWIIDYKSSIPTPAEDPEGFIQSETERYRPQLQTYAALFADRPEPVKTALYFTALARLHTL
jgi:ATP-dependent helicase/nuclease subunit A